MSSLVISHNMVVATREKKFIFSMFANFDETFGYASQLANYAMKQSDRIFFLKFKLKFSIRVHRFYICMIDLSICD